MTWVECHVLQSRNAFGFRLLGQHHHTVTGISLLRSGSPNRLSGLVRLRQLPLGRLVCLERLVECLGRSACLGWLARLERSSIPTQSGRPPGCAGSLLYLFARYRLGSGGRLPLCPRLCAPVLWSLRLPRSGLYESALPACAAPVARLLSTTLDGVTR
jgi:hypothetical protein